mgnify:CR=1 FL=1
MTLGHGGPWRKTIGPRAIWGLGAGAFGAVRVPFIVVARATPAKRGECGPRQALPCATDSGLGGHGVSSSPHGGHLTVRLSLDVETARC